MDWKHRGLRPADVLVASYPRSGNLWLRFMLHELLLGKVTWDRVRNFAPYVGRHASAPVLLPRDGRLVKTHEPYWPVYRRAINLVRDPRNSAISYYKFLLNNGKVFVPRGMDDAVAFDRFIDAYIGGRLDAHGTWNGHVESWIDARDAGKADVLLLRYEDMRSDPVDGLSRVAQWLGLSVDRERVEGAVAATSLDAMREATRDVVPPGMRRSASPSPIVNNGLVEGWRAVLTEIQADRFGAFAEGLRRLGYPER